MVRIEVKVEMAGPFLVGSRKLSTVSETLGYVPGSVLRGVVAETLLRERPEPDRRVPHPEHCPDREKCTFCQLFYPQTGPPPRFSNLYPTGGDITHPFPATARTCKLHPGFLRDVDPDERHGIFDILIRQYVFGKALDNGVALPFVYIPECPRCRDKAEPVSLPFYGIIEDRYQAPQILRSRLSRTAISRRRGAAQDDQLFTLNVLNERMDTDLLDPDGTTSKEATALRGHIWVRDESAEPMQEALRRVERIGAVRSRGMGLARIEIKSVSSNRNGHQNLADLAPLLDGSADVRFSLPEHLQKREDRQEPLRPESLAERIVAFNVRFQEEQDFYSRLGAPLPIGRWYFTVDLLSDVILTDDGLPTLSLTPEMLGLVGNGLPKVKLERPFIDRAYRSGWSGAHGLPRQMHLAVSMGGVYLYSVEKAGREETSQLLDRLERLEEDGVGLDRERGYGHVRVCLPFHLEVEAR